MGTILATAGKGGTGKTTLAALVIRTLKERKAGSVLAIDADPNSNLGEKLGVRHAATIVGIVDDISRDPEQIPLGITKERFLELKIQESLTEEEGFDLLTMGRPEGPGCYCFVNNLLRELIKNLMDDYSYVVIDNEAGMEHLSRRLVRSVDSLLVVSDSTSVGVRSAGRILSLIDELKIAVKEKRLIINKVKGDVLAALKSEIDKTGLPLVTVLPFDGELEESAVQNKNIFALADSNAALDRVRELFAKTVRL
jgi:CO dehydrogenase maturation factor